MTNHAKILLDSLKVEKHLASKQVIAQAGYYTNFARVFIPHEPFTKLNDGFEMRNTSDLIPKTTFFDNETNLERSIRRTRKAIKDYTFCNDFNLFVTLTMKEDRQNPEHSKEKLSNWFHNQRSRKGPFKYLVVPEFHKDQQSLHFHCLFQDYKGEVKRSYNNGRPVTKGRRSIYEIPSYTLGFNNVQYINPDIESKTRVSFYIQKYITKEMPIFFGKNRYWASKSLNKPIFEDNPEPWYKIAKPDREYENEFGRILEFDKGKNAIIDMFIEANQR